MARRCLNIVPHSQPRRRLIHLIQPRLRRLYSRVIWVVPPLSRLRVRLVAAVILRRPRAHVLSHLTSVDKGPNHTVPWRDPPPLRHLTTLLSVPVHSPLHGLLFKERKNVRSAQLLSKIWWPKRAANIHPAL